MDRRTGLVSFILCMAVLHVSCLWAEEITPSASPAETLKQYVTELQNDPDNRELREKIIKLALSLKPAPAVAEEVERHMVRGIVAVKEAKDQEDYQEAALEFEQAALAAPWFAEAYYNLGLVKEKAGDYAGATRSLKLYLLAAPGAPDAKKARRLMYELEYKQEKAEKKKHQEEELRTTIESLRHKFRGSYILFRCRTNNMRAFCNEKEYRRKNWHRMEGINTFPVLENGVIIVSWAERQGDYAYYIGIPNGPLLKNVRWISKKNEKDPNTPETEGRTIWAKVAEDGSVITLSGNRPPAPALYDPKTRYMYDDYRRR